MTDTFRCGHPKTEANIKVSPSTKGRCRICHTERLRRWRLANTTGRPKGRPPEFIDHAPIPITAEDRAWEEMVRNGSAMLLEGYRRYAAGRAA